MNMSGRLYRTVGRILYRSNARQVGRVSRITPRHDTRARAPRACAIRAAAWMPLRVARQSPRPRTDAHGTSDRRTDAPYTTHIACFVAAPAGVLGHTARI